MSERNGDRPAGWELVTIADVVVSKVEQGAPSTDFTYIDIGSINNKTKEIDSAKDLIAGSNVPSRAQQHVQAGDILVSMTRPNLNAVAKVPTELDGAICSTGFDVLQPIEVEPDWLFLVVKSRPFVEAMTSLVQGALYPAVRPADVRAYEFALPPLAEQRRIVAKIEALQQRSRRAREALSEVGPLLEQFRQSVLAAAFRGDLTADWRTANLGVEPASELLHRIRAERRRCWEQTELAKYEAKGQEPPQNWKEKYKESEPVDESDLPELPEGWCWARFDEILCELRNGVSAKPNETPPGTPILRINSVRSRKVLLDELRYLPNADNYIKTYRLRNQDLLFTRYNGSLELVGVCGLVQGIGDRVVLYPDKLMRVRIGHQLVLPEFIEMYFTSPSARQRVTRKAKTTSGQQGVSGADIKAQPVPLVPLLEQRQLITLLQMLLTMSDGIEAALSKTDGELDHLDQAILAKAFRGELVPQDPGDEPASVLLERIHAQPKQQAKAPKQSSKSHQASMLGKKSSRLEPQQLTLVEVLRSAD